MKLGHVFLHKFALALAMLALTAIPARSQSAFFREVVLRPKATQADGIRVVSILLGQRTGDLSSDAEFLRTKYVLPKNWTPDDKAVLSKGWMAYLLVRALELNGGAGKRLFGWNKRRAFQELVYLQIMPGKGGEHAKLTGPEVITLLDRSSAHRERERARKGAAETATGR
jgi:hypothetical protein